MENNAPVIVYAESTPNPATMKYIANRTFIENASIEYTDATDAKGAPIVQELFKFPFVKSVYVKNNFVTITKVPVVEWIEVMNEIREFLKEYLSSGKPTINELPNAKSIESKDKHYAPSIHTIPANPTELETKIIEILDEMIKPAVEQDGGEIAFKKFEEGVVTVALRGSCSGCPSSTITLKAGIENLLKRMVPGVESVVAENE